MSGQTNQAQYVTELVGERDSWLLVQDAARMTRHQQATILQWIQTGQLPVRPAHLSDLKLIQVRVSDLIQLAPLVTQERYVEELDGLEDRWLSQSDAARVTNMQPKTVQNWVQSGLLPVRPGGAGINKRTRQVRLSDLAQLTPIINLDAAISTPEGSAYLAMIPSEQAAIREEQRRQSKQLTDLQGRLDEQDKEQRRLLGLVEDLQRQVEARDKATDSLIARLYTEWGDDLKKVQGELELFLTQTKGEMLEEWLRKLNEQKVQMQQDMTSAFAKQALILQEVTRTVGLHEEEQKRLRDDMIQFVEGQDAALATLQQEVEARILEQRTKMEEALQFLTQQLRATRALNACQMSRLQALVKRQLLIGAKGR